MIAQVSLLIVSVLYESQAYPTTFQQQRQIYYPQTLPIHQQLITYQIRPQPVQFQVPAATSLLPDNVNTGLRYGQHQLVYVVPSGSQVYFEEQGGEGGQGTGESGAGFPENVINFVSGYFPWSGQKPLEPGANPSPEGGSSGPSTGGSTSPGSGNHQPSTSGQTGSIPEKGEIKPTSENSVGEEELSQQQRYFLLRNQAQRFYPQRPSVVSPAANLLYYSNYPQFADPKQGTNAIAFQKLLQKSTETKPVTPEKEVVPPSEGGETTEHQEQQTTQNEEMGPSIAQAKPQAVSVAGPGGVAAAAPVGTAIVGPGGMALSAPTATAVAGTKPSKPVAAEKDKVRAYFPRTSYYTY